MDNLRLIFNRIDGLESKMASCGTRSSSKSFGCRSALAEHQQASLYKGEPSIHQSLSDTVNSGAHNLRVTKRLLECLLIDLLLGNVHLFGSDNQIAPLQLPQSTQVPYQHTISAL
jgi:hypothetical protein